jgi:hypothetical protein
MYVAFPRQGYTVRKELLGILGCQKKKEQAFSPTDEDLDYTVEERS